ncbi:hypothetical protein [Microcoleus sp. CAWBG58]|uniref:hypothetical protein n=1 Tax=Microcoleus sp. CAWBG58 TaxID=2841651 RepID=UPI0025DBD45B|nr:hypothetical protein [Microcoleus sp. CAWBG58]
MRSDDRSRIWLAKRIYIWYFLMEICFLAIFKAESPLSIAFLGSVTVRVLCSSTTRPKPSDRTLSVIYPSDRLL